jgi:arabinofuranosyltransferase
MNNPKLYRQIITALCISLLALLILAILPRKDGQVAFRAGAFAPTVAQGETTELRSFYGFHEVEYDPSNTPFRWTDGLGNFVFRNGDRLGEPLQLQLRICGCRQPAPQQLLLQVNGRVVADLSELIGRTGWHEYTVLLPKHTIEYSPDILVELISDTTPNPDFGYPMGVALDTVRLAPAQAQTAYRFPEAVYLALGLLALALLGIWASRNTIQTAGSSNRFASIKAALLPNAPIVAWQSNALTVISLLIIVVQGYFYQHQFVPASIFAAAWIFACALVMLSRSNLLINVMLLFSLGMFILAPQILGSWILDDAYISFRYALNALLGNGFVFNPGERVEGYTNFLWMLLFVPIIGMDFEPALAALALTTVIALLSGLIVWQVVRSHANTYAAFAALLLFCTSTPFVLYGSRGGGLETALFSMLTALGALLYLRQLRPEHVAPSSGPDWAMARVGVVFAFAAMTRPEGILVTGIFGLHLVLRSLIQGGIAWRKAFSISAGFLILFAPYYLWRYNYYGFPLPNTFYAKVGSSGAQVVRGFNYALNFVRSQWPLLLLAIAGINPLRRVQMRSLRERLEHYFAHPGSALAMFVTIYSAYIIAVGGDHFPEFRFFVPLIAPITMLAGLACGWFIAIMPVQIARPLALGLAALAVAWQVPQLYHSRTLNGDSGVWTEYTVVEKNREIGLWLRDNTEPDTLIGTGIAGALPYYADRPVLDMLGLNDLHIGHLEVETIGQGVAGSEKTDNEYILDKQPVYIPYNTAGALIDEPRFHQMYERGVVHGPEGRWIRLYKLRTHDYPAGWISLENQ